MTGKNGLQRARVQRDAYLTISVDFHLLQVVVLNSGM